MADLVVVATSVVKYAGATTAHGTAGETITAGQALYMSASNLLMKADASTAVKAACVGIALNGGAINQPIEYIKSGGLNPGVAVVVGTQYGVTDTAGGIGPLADRGAADFITPLGIAITTSRINVAIAPSGVAIA